MTALVVLFQVFDTPNKADSAAVMNAPITLEDSERGNPVSNEALNLQRGAPPFLKNVHRAAEQTNMISR